MPSLPPPEASETDRNQLAARANRRRQAEEVEGRHSRRARGERTRYPLAQVRLDRKHHLE